MQTACGSSRVAGSVGQSLPAGSTGDAAVFTEHLAHVIRKVLLRQVAILNYVIAF
jgi:hypothetical protein